MLKPSNRTIQTDQEVTGDVSELNLSLHLFIRLSAKRCHFTGVDFKYSIFDTCYLRDCTFTECQFIGCRFIGTNMHGSTFSGCDFSYAHFERTIIDPSVLDTCCPPYENLKSRFARTLRMNFSSIGDAEAVNKAVSVELAATELHRRKSWQSNESYYRKKYRGFARVRAFISWLTFWFLDFIWGNGESAYKLARTVVLFLILLAVCDTIVLRNPLLVTEYLDALVDAPQHLLGTKTPQFPGIVLAFITFVRLVVMGLFVSILVRRLTRR